MTEYSRHQQEQRSLRLLMALIFVIIMGLIGVAFVGDVRNKDREHELKVQLLDECRGEYDVPACIDELEEALP